MFAPRRAGVKGIAAVADLIEAGAGGVETVDDEVSEVGEETDGGVVSFRTSDDGFEFRLLERVRIQPFESFADNRLRIEFFEMANFFNPVVVDSESAVGRRESARCGADGRGFRYGEIDPLRDLVHNGCLWRFAEDRGDHLNDFAVLMRLEERRLKRAGANLHELRFAARGHGVPGQRMAEMIARGFIHAGR